MHAMRLARCDRCDAGGGGGSGRGMGGTEVCMGDGQEWSGMGAR